VSKETTNNITRDIDFVMVGLQWVEKAVSSLTITVNDESVNLGNFYPGTPNSSTTSVSVNMSNGVSGYNLSIKRDDSDTTLDLTTDASKNITDATS